MARQVQWIHTKCKTGRSAVAREARDGTIKRECRGRKLSEALVAQPSNLAGTLGKLRVFLLPVMAISMVFVMLIPVPSVVLDLLLAASITASIIVFLTAIQVRRADGFLRLPHPSAVADDVPVESEPGFEPDASCCMATKARTLPAP